MLTDRDEAREQRDQHERAAATLADELTEVRTALESAQTEGAAVATVLAEARAEVERLTAQLAAAETARDDARAALAAERRELGEQRRGGVVLARHRHLPDSAGATVRHDEHVAALEGTPG